MSSTLSKKKARSAPRYIASSRFTECVTCRKRKRNERFRTLDVEKGTRSDSCLLCESRNGVIEADPKQHARNSKAKVVDFVKAKMQRELLRREMCRRHLIPFIKRFEANYQDGWIHRKIAAELERFVEQVVNGEEPRLMLFVPPRHGKSLMASDYLPSWVLGKYPDLELISTSYSDSLPLEFSRRIRTRIQSEAFRTVFPDARLSKTANKIEHWKTTAEGGYLAAGVGGGITGHGAHIFLVDDPIKDAEQADSETVRENLWSWWSSTASSRVAPGGGVLIIQTRWHDDDLSGRLIQQMQDALEDEDIPEEEIDRWRIISFAAIAESDEWELPDGTIQEGTPSDLQIHEGARLLRQEGEALHEERWPLRFLKKKRRSMLKRHWAALYQQNPVPDEGVTFQRDMFIERPSSMISLNRYRVLAAFDLAIGKKEQNDWTVGAVGALDPRGRLHMIDLVRGRWGSFEIVEAIIAVHRNYRPARIGIEQGQLELAIKDVLTARCRELNVFPIIDRTLKPVTDKHRRAAPLQGMMQHHRVLFPNENTHPWMRRVMEEMLRFPAGRNDDIVDAMAWLARMALKTQPPLEGGRGKRKKSWKDKLGAHTGSKRHPMAA